MRVNIYKSLSLCVIIVSQTIAQQEDLWTTFTNNSGLASNEVRCIKETSEGALWFGTNEGASRFQDGIWTTFTRFDGLADDGVSSIIETNDGALWFGTTGGATRLKDGIWSSFTASGRGLFEIIEASDNSLWFGSTYHGAAHLKDGIWTTYTTKDGLAGNTVTALFQSSDGAMWFGTQQFRDVGLGSFEPTGVSRLLNGIWETFYDNGVLAYRINHITETKDGAVWVATSGGAARFQDGIWKTFTREDGLASSRVLTILESSDGTLWFGTGDWVTRLRDSTWTDLANPTGSLFVDVLTIHESNDGSFWFGTELEGASRFQEAIWTTIGRDEGLPTSILSTVIEASDGSLWFGGLRGVSRLKDGMWTHYSESEGLAHRRVDTGIEASDGSLWFGFGGRGDYGVSRFHNGIWTTLSVDSGLVSNNVLSMFESSDSTLWFGTDLGVSRFKDGAWTTFTTDSGLVFNIVDAITETSDGGMLFGTILGVSRFHQGIWTDLGLSLITAILEAKDGAVWFGSLGSGVLRIQNGLATFFTTGDGLADNEITTIIESSDGAIWFGTAIGGVSRYKDGFWLTFNAQEDGLADNWVRSIVESRDKRLWFATSGGASRFQPDRNPPHTAIIDGPSNEEIIGIATPLFSFRGRDFRTERQQLYYAYAVADTSVPIQDVKWLPLTQITTIETSPLTDGTYAFYVRARDDWGNLDPTPARRVFTVDVTQPTVTFNSHKAGEFVAGRVLFIGNAFDTSPTRDFKAYGLRYGFGKSKEEVTEWKNDLFSKLEPTTEVFNDTLAIWNTEDLLNGAYVLQLTATDSFDHISDVFLELNVSEASERITASHGSKIIIDSGRIELSIPPNALPRDLKLNVRECGRNEIVLLDTPMIEFANICVEISLDELEASEDDTLRKPITLTLTYSDSLIKSINERKLAFFYSHNGDSSWEPIGGSINPMQNKIVVSFKKLGVFALYEDSTEGGKDGVVQVDIQPRVFSPHSAGVRDRADISFGLGDAGAVNVKVYNSAGRLITILAENAQMNRGINVVTWHGVDMNGKTCPSGLYVVAIEAEGKMKTKTVAVMNQ